MNLLGNGPPAASPTEARTFPEKSGAAAASPGKVMASKSAILFNSDRAGGGISWWLPLMALLLLPVILFFRTGFFFFEDDWTTLIQMTGNPFWRYLTLPDGEQWFPFFHLVYYALVSLGGERYYLFVLINCLGTGVNAFLLYLFFRRQWRLAPALALSLFYAGAALHHAIAWNAFYVCYLLSLGFFLGALLLTDDYLHSPSPAGLVGIGACALLSILSHNYTLLALPALPLYALLLGDPGARQKCPALTMMVAIVYLPFVLGYLTFAGAPAAASHNLGILSNLPGLGYFLHLACGAFLAPFFYLFWGYFHFPVYAMVFGSILLAGTLSLIWFKGAARERRLMLWAMLFNALPFLLISLARYQRPAGQAFVARYGVFTLVGALLLVGTAWTILARRFPGDGRLKILSLGLLAWFFTAQIVTLPRWQAGYLEAARAARLVYERLGQRDNPDPIPPEIFARFCPTAHPTLTAGQVKAIRQLLRPPPPTP